MRSLPLNCDLGEGCGSDAALMPLIDQASIACGGHAGDVQTMRRCVGLTREHGVAIGAHPAYPDTDGFGRRSLDIKPAVLSDSLARQLDDLAAVAQADGVLLSYIKPHGALYHDLWSKPVVCEVLLSLAAARRLPLMVQAGRGRLPVSTGRVELLREAFADRAYSADGRLLGRSKPGAVLDAPEAARQVSGLLANGEIVAAGDSRVSMSADTLCLHGDHPQAIEVAHAIRRVMPKS